jgi:hypothetical protein
MSFEDNQINSQIIIESLYKACFSDDGIRLLITRKFVNYDMSNTVWEVPYSSSVLYNCAIISDDVHISKMPCLLWTNHRFADQYDIEKSRVGYLEITDNTSCNPTSKYKIDIYTKADAPVESHIERSINDGCRLLNIYPSIEWLDPEQEAYIRYSMKDLLENKLPIHKLEIKYTKTYNDCHGAEGIASIGKTGG